MTADPGGSGAPTTTAAPGEVPIGGECLTVPERLVVAPVTGTFRPLPPNVVTTEGEIVLCGTAVGIIECSGDAVAVESPFDGFLMGLLVHDGERVRAGRPVAWLRAL